MQLPNRMNPIQKLFAVMLMGGAILGGVWTFNNYLAPFFIDFFVNIWKLTLIGGPLVLASLYIINNPFMVWGFFKTLSWNLTKWAIKLDPLSVMDRYVDFLDIKLSNLRKVKVVLEARKTASSRKIESLKKSIDDSLKQGQAAIKLKDNRSATLAGSRVKGMRDSIELYMPNYKRIVTSVEFLNVLSDNWEVAQIKLREEIARKREEFEMLRDNAKALNQAESFVNGNTDEGRIYKESLKALEEKVSLKMAYIDDFEKRSKDMLAGIKIDNAVQEDEGMAILQEYMNSDKLLLPDDFTDVSFMEADKVPISSTKFNLLSKKS